MTARMGEARVPPDRQAASSVTLPARPGAYEEDWDAKLERYRAAGIGEVVRFDPDDDAHPIRVWDRVDGDLVEREPPEDGVFECSCLGLFWVAVPHPTFVRMLRLARDRAGKDLLPTLEEAEKAEARAREEEARARQEAELAHDQLAAEVAELRRQLAEQSAANKPGKPTKAAKPAKKQARRRS